MHIEEKVYRKKGKFFHARKKIIYPGAIYHVTQRAPGREITFVEEKDYLVFLSQLKETKRKYNLNIFCFALMLNHLHILLRINEANLREAMHSLFTRYAKYFNNKYERKGHVFSGRYAAALCLNDVYLLTSSIYIHLNPYKAGLVKNPFNYRWTSLNLYVQEKDRISFVDYKFILEILDNKDIKHAKQIYKKYIVDSMKLNYPKIFEDLSLIHSFKDNLLKSVIGKMLSKIQGRNKKKFFSELEIDRKIEKLRKYKRLNSPYDLKARKYLIEQMKAQGYTYSAIAQRLGISKRSVIRTLNIK